MIAGCLARALVPHPLVFVAAVIVVGGQLALAVGTAHGTLFSAR